MGWALDETLQAIGSISAQEIAFEANKGLLNDSLIHHSDRGVQYCCRDYINPLEQHKVAISMTQNGDPYENALAERVNRTIKEDMLQNRGFVTFETAKEAISRAINNYNTLRPHGSCNYHTPTQVHQMKGELGRRWRKRKPLSMEKVQEKESTFIITNES